MARVTVEDCILRVPNRFDLVLYAGQRARAIAAGAPLTVERDDDKNPVVALREIANANVTPDQMLESLIKDQQKYVEIEEPVEDEVDFVAIQEQMSAEISEPSAAEEMAEDMLAEEGEEGAEPADAAGAAGAETEEPEAGA